MDRSIQKSIASSIKEVMYVLIYLKRWKNGEQVALVIVLPIDCGVTLKEKNVFGKLAYCSNN